ncbi:retrograde regulation protein 2 [Trichoderma parareesei]|uniref:Retrograde regulation protein 2 n=1 Tax=Trichoderma parareesei TaxID=858221 RepID=A0A2H2ZGN4_TRIPA|nr:retrograde regulation protein 2 [Trichoderma parareesei]
MPAANANVVTLDNLSQKLPPWRPDEQNHLFAVVDMGSNGIRFSITSLAPPRTRLLDPVYTAREALSLFDALTPSADGLVFPAATIVTVASAIARFHHLAVSHDVPPEHILVLATEAMRRAANAPDMLDAIADATGGLTVSILDPPVETLLGAVMGSRSGLGGIPGGALFLDLGGGSVQMTWVDTSAQDYEMEAALAGGSLPYGAAKLMRVLQENPEHVQAAETAKLSDGLRDLFARLCARFPALEAIRAANEEGEQQQQQQQQEKPLVDVYMCGGGFRGYGSMLMHDDPISPYPISSSNTYAVRGSRFKDTGRMLQLNASYEGKIFGLSKRRRQQFPAIVAVVDAFVQAVPYLGWVTFCGGSNRQGALMMKLPREIRESNPLDVLANLKEDDGGAERQVFQAILSKLADSLPPSLAPAIPTIFTTGAGTLFVREIWRRTGHDADANTSFALHHAVSRDTDCPGLTHLVRALVGVGIAARWGGGLGPLDAQLHKGLQGILDGRAAGAAFWAQYLGAVAGVLAAVFPVLPRLADEVLGAISFESRVEQRQGKKDRVLVEIGLASEYARRINEEDLVDQFNSAAKLTANKAFAKAISAQIVIQS